MNRIRSDLLCHYDRFVLVAFDPDFDLDEDGLAHEKPALPERSK